MSNLNYVSLIGRLTRDPETKVVGTHNICEISIAFDIGFGEKKKVAFIEVKAWNKTSEFINNSFKKGDEILIQGYLDYETWEDKETGKKRSKHLIVCDKCSFVGFKNKNSESDSKKDSTDIPF